LFVNDYSPDSASDSVGDPSFTRILRSGRSLVNLDVIQQNLESALKRVITRRKVR
jgi:hypothetical protein